MDEGPEDGLQFDPSSVTAAPIRDQAEYDGIRVKLIAHLGSARIPLQVDIGFGDAITPDPEPATFPALLEFPAPRIRIYPRETVIAEKLHGMVLFGTNDPLFVAMIKERCKHDGLAAEGGELYEHFRAHIHRGVALVYKRVKKLPDMIHLMPELPRSRRGRRAAGHVAGRGHNSYAQLVGCKDEQRICNPLRGLPWNR